MTTWTDISPGTANSNVLQIADGTVTEPKVADRAVTSAKLAVSAVKAEHVSGVDTETAAIRAKLEVQSAEEAADATAAYIGDGDSFSQANTGAVARPVVKKMRETSRSLFDFIPTARHAAIREQTSDYDCTADIITAMNAAAEDYYRWIDVPPGLFLCEGKIVNGTTMPDGIGFRALGRRRGGLNSPDDFSIIRWTGENDYLIDIRHPLGTTERGNWVFEGLLFQATSPSSGIFSINWLDQSGNTYTPTDNSTTPDPAAYITLRDCRIVGAQGAGSSQTGDGIRARNTMHLRTDTDCVFRGWRRGISLAGSDNARIRGSFIGNTRHIMHVAQGTYGNDLVIEKVIFRSVVGGAESRYSAYLEGRSQTVDASAFEDPNGEASMYINGLRTFVVGVQVSPDIPFFHLGPLSRDALILRPYSSAGAAVPAPIYDPSEALDSSASTYAVRVVAPSPEVSALLRPHPRLRLESDDLVSPGNAVYPAQNFLLDAAGPRQRQYLMTAFNFSGKTGSGSGYGAVSLVSDDNAYYGTGATASNTGFAIRLPVSSGGFVWRMFVGKHFQNGDTVRVSIRYRGGGDPTFALRMRALKNGSLVTQVDPAYSNTYARAAMSFAVSAALDDEYALEFFNAGGDQLVYIDAVLVEIVDPAIADLDPGTATTSQIATAVNAMLAAMRDGMTIA